VKKRVKRKSKKVHLMTGNEAVGEAAVRAGCAVYAGYPITPQNELTAYMSKRMDDTKRVFIQSESELAAINMVFGASAAGARAMTTSSSPGISLKQEGISYIAGCRLPAVIVNVMRGGPGLGNIAPSQADYFQATKGGGHGDYHMIVLAPSSGQEAMDLTMLSFDLADRYRMPVMVLTDGLLGQMMEPVALPNEIKPAKTEGGSSWALTGAKNRKPRSIKSLFLKPGTLEGLNMVLQKTYDTVKSKEIRYEPLLCDDAELIIVAYGSTSRMARAAARELREENKRVGLFRPITLWPFPYKELQKYSKNTKKFLTVEMSAGQMVEDVRLSVEKNSSAYFYGRMGGGVPAKEQIKEEILKCLKKQPR
jgi:2-oxoglutarate ferredoxin oxidoreductase subunit alpha